jgi:hypothetical protein
MFIERMPNTISQLTAKEWLLDDRHSSGSGSLPQVCVRMTGDKDGWHLKTAIPQPCDQLQAIHGRHLIVDNQTAGVMQIALPQQLVGPRIGAHVESLELKRELMGISHRRIIVNDDD